MKMPYKRTMRLKIIRDLFTAASATGALTVDGVFECDTLEDTDRHLEAGGEKVADATAIPRGTYHVVMDFSPRFQTIMPHVLDVPGFVGVRIHSGNRPDDTEGCILVGRRMPERADWISGSHIAYSALLLKLRAADARGETITLEVT